MTCKDCIHSGLCYKENDYENFPDRCGDFISDKVLEERPQGKWKVKALSTFPQYQPDEYICPFCNTIVNYKTNFCHRCGADMRGEK